MENVQFGIECPKCKSENCYCRSYYETGVETIWCPDCEQGRKLIHKRDENGNFVWKDEMVDVTDDSIITEVVLTEEIAYCFYTIDTNVNDFQREDLHTKNDYDNFISYIDGLSKYKHNMKRVVVYRNVGFEMIKEIDFPKAA